MLDGADPQQTLGNHILPPAGPAGGADRFQFDTWSRWLFEESEINPHSLLSAPDNNQRLLAVFCQKASAAAFKESGASEGWRGLDARRSAAPWAQT